MDDTTRPIRIDPRLRVLTSLELQVRNLIALEDHVGRVLDEVEGEQSALTTDLRQRLTLCDLEAVLDGTIRLRSALEPKEG